ncbi:MAG: hypothetical protein IKD74_07895 [Clostridia bacterium]|nr:hypothetical protein [Clostridia bacterium]
MKLMVQVNVLLDEVGRFELVVKYHSSEEDTIPDLSNLKVYKVFSNREKELVTDFDYNKDIVTSDMNDIEISYSEDGITSKIKVPVVVKEHVHEWGEWKVTKEPTENEEGQKERVCLKNENHKEVVRIDKLPNNENIESKNDEESSNTEAPKALDKLIDNKNSFIIVRTDTDCETNYDVAEATMKILKQNGYSYFSVSTAAGSGNGDETLGFSKLDLSNYKYGAILIVKDGKLYDSTDPNVDALKSDEDIINWLSKYIEI